MNARALVALALGTLLAGAACRSEQVAERWQQIEREREAGEQAGALRHGEMTNVNTQASLLIENMERQIERTANLEKVVSTRRAAEVELMELRPRVLADRAGEADEQRARGEDEIAPSQALALIDRRRMEIRSELEREAFVLDDEWPAYVGRLRALSHGLRGDVEDLARRSSPRVVSVLEPVGAERAI